MQEKTANRWAGRVHKTKRTGGDGGKQEKNARTGGPDAYKRKKQQVKRRASEQDACKRKHSVQAGSEACKREKMHRSNLRRPRQKRENSTHLKALFGPLVHWRQRCWRRRQQ